MEEIREGRLGSEAAVPGVAPGFVIQVQADPGLGYFICNQLGGCNGIFEKYIFKKSNAAAFASGRVSEGPASEAHGEDRTMHHLRSYLEIVGVSDRIIRIVNTSGQKAGNKLSFHAVQAYGSRLVKLRRLFLFVLEQEQSVDVVFQGGVHSMSLGGRSFGIVANASIYIGMANGITNIVAKIAAKIGEALLSLLPGRDISQITQIAGEKVLNMVFMHVRGYVAVIPVSQDGYIIEKHVGPLQAKLVKPTVFGNNEFKLIVRQIVVSFHTQNVMCSKTRHRNSPFYIFFVG